MCVLELVWWEYEKCCWGKNKIPEPFGNLFGQWPNSIWRHSWSQSVQLYNITICPAHKASDWLGCFPNHKMGIHKGSISPFWVTDKFDDMDDDSEIWNQATSSPLLLHLLFLLFIHCLTWFYTPPPLSPVCLYWTSQAETYITDGWRSLMAQSCVCARMPLCMLTWLYVVILVRIGIQGMKTSRYGWHVSRLFTRRRCVTHMDY